MVFATPYRLACSCIFADPPPPPPYHLIFTFCFYASRSWSSYSAQRVLKIYKGPSSLVVVWSGSSPTPSPLSRQQVVSLSQSSCESPVQLTDGRRGGGRRWARSQIVRRRESLALNKLFNTLWSGLFYLEQAVVVPFVHTYNTSSVRVRTPASECTDLIKGKDIYYLYPDHTVGTPSPPPPPQQSTLLHKDMTTMDIFQGYPRILKKYKTKFLHKRV
jgi:hypothetical protein